MKLVLYPRTKRSNTTNGTKRSVSFGFWMFGTGPNVHFSSAFAMSENQMFSCFHLDFGCMLKAKPFGNGTHLSAPKSEHVRFLDIDCTL